MSVLLFGRVSINVTSVADIRYNTNILKFFTALWIFTRIEMYIWKWHLFFQGSPLDSHFDIFFMNSFPN